MNWLKSAATAVVINFNFSRLHLNERQYPLCDISLTIGCWQWNNSSQNYLNSKSSVDVLMRRLTFRKANVGETERALNSSLPPPPTHKNIIDCAHTSEVFQRNWSFNSSFINNSLLSLVVSIWGYIMFTERYRMFSSCYWGAVRVAKLSGSWSRSRLAGVVRSSSVERWHRFFSWNSSPSPYSAVKRKENKP